MRRAGYRGPFARAASLAVGCAAAALGSCSDTPTGSFTITTGDELDALTRAPAPTTLIVESVGLDGKTAELARTPLPAEEISLGDKTRTDIGAIRVTAQDPSGTALLFGETLFVQFGALEDAPLDVFVQRKGELARLPRGPAALDAPLLGVAVGRYIVAASGTSAFLYDLLTLRPTGALPTFRRAAKSLATFGTAAVVIDEFGATTVDLSTGAMQDLPAPAGGTFAEIAGGATVIATDGSAYVVGGTRPGGGPTARVLTIAKDGNVAFATLAAAREGACATWVEGRGVVVYGGSATGAGAEVLGVGGVQGAALAYPPDAVRGGGVTALDASHVLVVGGVGSSVDVDGAGPVRVMDLSCAAACALPVWPGSVPLVRAEAFALAPDAVLVAGDDAAGASRVFRAAPSGPREVPLRAPRRGARLLALPSKGAAALVGGASPIEQYRD